MNHHEPAEPAGPGGRPRLRATSWPDGRSCLTATATLPGAVADAVIASFTAPERLERWWGGELRARLEPGGEYVVAFGAIGEVLRGEVLAYKPGRFLEFSWAWGSDAQARFPSTGSPSRRPRRAAARRSP